ncbi:MAG: HAL/PAL/TAL family ammonia-lyase [Gaiellales bacterium]
MDAVVTLSGRDLTPAAVHEIARSRTPVEIAGDALDRMRTAQQAVERAVADGAAVYGITTGLGSGVTTRLDPASDGDPALRTLRERAVSVGEPLPQATVRATMAARLNGLCAGGSGAAPEVAQTLAAMLNGGVHPLVPRHGSIGAADLCLLAHIGLVVAGEGEAEIDGRRLPGGRALAAAGIAPAQLRLKDGLALCSASSVSAGAGALALVRARRLLEWLQSAAALSMEGFRANLTPIDPRASAARPAPGQEWAAAGLRERLAGGSLTEPGAARRLQDPISFRCASAVHGALHTSLDALEAAIEPELNGASDNPLVLAADGAIISTGNFHTPVMALAADTVAIAVAQSAAPCAERVGRLSSTELSGLPANLSPTGSAGMAPLQKPAQALVSAIRHRAAPVAIHPSVNAASVEDDATNAAPAVLRLDEQLDLLSLLIAIELVCAAQAVDLARPARLGAVTREVHRMVRELVEPLKQERPMTADIEAVATMIG